MINAKKMDALEFVNSLEGGWDCIIFDPPYLKSSPIKKNTADNSTYDFMVDKKERTIINEKYLEELLFQIKIKTNSFCLIKFFYKPLIDSDITINWYKYEMGSLAGNKIQKNTEYLNFYYNNFKPNYKESKMLPETVAFRRKYGINATKEKPFEKPVKLYKAILEYLKPTKVLDCFAGSYNSAKACDELAINIDICDKYLEPPSVLNNNLKYLLE